MASLSLPFKYVAGDAALDLVNTVDWTDAGLVDERLGSYEGLTRWAEGAGVLPAVTAAALRARAASRPDEARGALARAVALRGLLERLFAGVAAGHDVAPDALAELDAAFRDALGRLRLAAAADDPARVTWAWEGWGEALDCPLWPVVWAAARLLASDDRTRVRRCGAPRCGWMYVDRSRNGLRRWCQTDVCGAREKARRYHARKQARGADDTRAP